ncbi:MAG: helix-turn-helix transcriptional regulator [Nocardia sp.]|nr:helix-turn-helix transcriptional regulator [Nocardia sp.]
MTTTRLTFRNVDADPSDPVETWPIEAIHTALQRGTLVDWRRMIRAVREDPWGPVARNIEYVLSYDRPYGTAELFEKAIAKVRNEAEQSEKATVAAQLAAEVAASGLTARDFAERLGTSPPRLSTYLSGKVTPSATLMIRAHRVAVRAKRNRDGMSSRKVG